MCFHSYSVDDYSYFTLHIQYHVQPTCLKAARILSYCVPLRLFAQASVMDYATKYCARCTLAACAEPTYHSASTAPTTLSVLLIFFPVSGQSSATRRITNATSILKNILDNAHISSENSRDRFCVKPTHSWTSLNVKVRRARLPLGISLQI